MKVLFCDIIQLCPFSAQKSNEPSENSCKAVLSSFESFKKSVNLNERLDMPPMTSVFLWYREHCPQSICSLSVSACCPVMSEDLRIISSLCQLYSVFYLVSFSANSCLAVGK